VNSSYRSICVFWGEVVAITYNAHLRADSRTGWIIQFLRTSNFRPHYYRGIPSTARREHTPYLTAVTWRIPISLAASSIIVLEKSAAYPIFVWKPAGWPSLAFPGSRTRPARRPQTLARRSSDAVDLLKELLAASERFSETAGGVLVRMRQIAFAAAAKKCLRPSRPAIAVAAQGEKRSWNQRRRLPKVARRHRGQTLGRQCAARR